MSKDVAGYPGLYVEKAERHTPPPWRHTGGGSIMANGREVAVVDTDKDIELVVAAPKLLAALRAIVEARSMPQLHRAHRRADQLIERLEDV